MGVALTSCTVPAVGHPTFDLPEDEMEVGVGIHGEPGRSRVTLEARVDSEAIDFYRHLGFSSVDLLPCYYQDGGDAVVMERPI